MTSIQEKYVPLATKNEKVDLAAQIPFGGDLLTEERAINIQKAFLDGDNSFERLEGLSPKFEDWHLKKTLYEVFNFIICTTVLFLKDLRNFSLIFGISFLLKVKDAVFRKDEKTCFITVTFIF